MPGFFFDLVVLLLLSEIEERTSEARPTKLERRWPLQQLIFQLRQSQGLQLGLAWPPYLLSAVLVGFG